MRWRRSLVLYAILGVMVGVVLWLRPARGPRERPTRVASALPTAASSLPAAGGRPFVPFVWLEQPGVGGRRIAGRVVHAGEPVAKAVVRLTTEELRIGEWALAQVETDEAGRFDFGDWPATQYRVVAQAEGLVAAGTVADLRAPDPRPPPDALTIELRDCDLVVRGSVRDEAGDAVAGARLRAGTYAEEFGIAHSDEEGHYDVCVSAGPVHIEASADGFGTTLKHTRGRGDVKVDFVLAPEILVSGRVVDGDGEPVAGAAVAAATNGHEPGVVAETGPTGQFRLTGLAAGKYLVVARADDRAAEETVTLAPGGAGAEVVLTLEPRAPFSGRVLAGGQPAAGATVIVRSVDGPWMLGSAVSQANGRFAIAGLPREPVKVSVEDHKLVSPDEKLDLAVLREVDLVCERLAKVSGRVLRGGKPVARADVQLYQGEKRTYWLSARDDGTFTFEGVAAGSYQIAAQSIPEGAAMSRRPLEIGTRDVDGVVLELDHTASIAGVVVDVAGALVAGVSVSFRRDDEHGYALTADDGTFLVTGLEGGEYWVDVGQWGDGGYRHYRPPAGQRFPRVHLPDANSRVTDVRVTVVRGNSTISGSVVRGGQPVAGLTIAAHGQNGSGRARSGPDGTFVIAELVPGRYRLYVERDGEPRHTRMEVDAGAKDVRVDLPPVGKIEGTLRGFRVAPQVSAVALDDDGMRVRGEVKDTRFSIVEVPVGTYEVHALAASGAYGNARVTVAADQVARATIDAGAAAKVTGVVTDWSTGAPIAGAYCSWYAQGGFEDRHVETDNKGAFAFAVPAGRIHIHCYSVKGPSSPTRQVAVELAPDASAHVAIELIVGRRHGRYSMSGVQLEGEPPTPLRVAGLRGAAEASGLRVGDVATQIDGQSLAGVDANGATFLLSMRDPGTPATLTVQRDGAEVTFEVAVDPMPMGFEDE